MQRAWLWLSLALIVGVYGGYQKWSERAVPHTPGVLVAAEPVQKQLGGERPRFRRHDAEIVAVARFSMEARVLGVERYRADRMAALVPVDIAFGWGPMSDSSVLSRITISQGNRFYFWQTADFPVPRKAIERHSANMHLIPADAAVEARIKAARVGQLVTLSGYLVDVKSDAGWTMSSSTTRDDTGAGACEVIWVESFE